MPANLSPEYKAAEAAFRAAREPRERLDRLRDMLRTIPKHKGTDHLQADIKRRIKELSEEIEAPKKGPARGGPSHVVRPEGAAQLALLGPPNSGKSALHARFSGSHAHVADLPLHDPAPQAGMMTHEDVHLRARGPARGLAGASGAVARDHAADRGRVPAGGRSDGIVLRGADARRCTRCCARST